jgi:hypothetical protein
MSYLEYCATDISRTRDKSRRACAIRDTFRVFRPPNLIMTTETKSADPKEWNLEAGSEYRFELDPGNTLAIKVCELNTNPNDQMNNAA